MDRKLQDKYFQELDIYGFIFVKYFVAVTQGLAVRTFQLKEFLIKDKIAALGTEFLIAQELESVSLPLAFQLLHKLKG